METLMDNDSDDDVSDAANGNNSDDNHDNDNSDFLVVGWCACVEFTWKSIKSQLKVN